MGFSSFGTLQPSKSVLSEFGAHEQTNLRTRLPALSAYRANTEIIKNEIVDTDAETDISFLKIRGHGHDADNSASYILRDKLLEL